MDCLFSHKPTFKEDSQTGPFTNKIELRQAAGKKQKLSCLKEVENNLVIWKGCSSICWAACRLCRVPPVPSSSFCEVPPVLGWALVMQSWSHFCLCKKPLSHISEHNLKLIPSSCWICYLSFCLSWASYLGCVSRYIVCPRKSPVTQRQYCSAWKSLNFSRQLLQGEEAILGEFLISKIVRAWKDLAVYLL